MKNDVEDIPMVYLLYVLLVILVVVGIAAVVIVRLIRARTQLHYYRIWMQSVHRILHQAGPTALQNGFRSAP